MKANKLTKETILQLGVYERNFPDFKSGDTIIVTSKITEGAKFRLQDFEGTVISLKGSGISKTFCIRRIIDGVAIERILPYYSPSLVSITVKNKGAVRRAKLYYLKDRYGKSSEVKLKKSIKEIKKIEPIVTVSQSEAVSL